MARHKIIPTSDPPLCQCGCGEIVKWSNRYKKWNDYINGHFTKIQWEDEEHKKSMANKMLKNWQNSEFRKKLTEKCNKIRQSDEYKNKMSEIIKVRWQDPEYKEKISAKMKKQYENPEEREKTAIATKQSYEDNPKRKTMIGLASKKRWQNSEYKRIVSEKIKIKLQDSEHRELISTKTKQLWQNPDFIKKTLISRKKSPNIPESLLLALTPENIEYVGNGKFWRTLKLNTLNGIIIKHKNPDFKVKNQYKVIEYNGYHWHKDDYPDEVWYEAWAIIGYECLIIWEDELKDIESVLKKIADFVGVQSWQMSLAM